MTPRLRMLSIGLVLSLAYAIYDYVERNSEKPKTYVAKKEKKRARTAGVSRQRAIDLKKKIIHRSWLIKLITFIIASRFLNLRYVKRSRIISPFTLGKDSP